MWRMVDALFRGSFQVQLHIALRIHHDRFAFGSEQVGSVRQTSQIELFEVHRPTPQQRLRC